MGFPRDLQHHIEEMFGMTMKKAAEFTGFARYKPKLNHGVSGPTIDLTGAELDTLLASANGGAGTVAGTRTYTGNNIFLGGLDAGTSGTEGNIDIFPATAARGKLRFAAADNASGDHILTFTKQTISANRGVGILDPTADAVMSLMVRAAGAPGTRGGFQGMFYQNTSNGDLYICTVADATAATFKQATLT